MKHNPKINQRKSIRLYGYDYSKAGLYFITICTHNRENLFGEIIEGKIILNEYGKIVRQQWIDLPKHYKNIKLDEYCIMPNHFHCIIEIIENVDNNVGAGLSQMPAPFCPNPPANAANTSTMDKTDTARTGQVMAEMKERICKPAPTGYCLSEIIRGFKSYTSKYINKLRKTTGIPVWQRNYYDNIIRDENAHLKISEYIKNNPILWKNDRYF